MLQDTKSDGTDEGQLSASTPAISLPKGGGAIRGIGEKFAANPVTGTGSMNVPIATSPSRSGFGPQLSLSYDSGSGNGPAGRMAHRQPGLLRIRVDRLPVIDQWSGCGVAVFEPKS